MMTATAIQEKMEKSPVPRIAIIIYFLFCLMKPEILFKQNWNKFLLVIKATALKQQISKFYPQILSTEASFTFMTGH